MTFRPFIKGMGEPLIVEHREQFNTAHLNGLMDGGVEETTMFEALNQGYELCGGCCNESDEYMDRAVELLRLSRNPQTPVELDEGLFPSPVFREVDGDA